MAETKPSRRSTRTTERTRTTGDGGPREGADLVEDTMRGAAEFVRSGAESPMAAPLGPLGVGEAAAESDITNELEGGGVALGSFVKSVGLAVAAAQAALDKTLVETAKALSDTKINTVAVFEQQIKDDDGTMDKGNVHIQELPLTNYLMPTAYQWSRVYLEADMNVQEFNSRSGVNIQQRNFSADARVSGSYGLGGFGVKGSAGMSYGSTSTGVDASAGTDLAAGKLHMEATLEPRGDVELPRPFVLQKGPRMTLQVEDRKPIPDPNDAAKSIGQEVTVRAIVKKTDGSNMEINKPLLVNINEPSLTYTASGKTDGNGEMTIKITRKGDPATPTQAMVRVSFGLVTGSVGISV